MRKLTLNSAQSIRELIQSLAGAFHEQRFLHRLHCVLLIAEGRGCYEVARWFGEHPRTIERWVHALIEHGAEGLRDHQVGGRPGRLAGDQARRLALDLQSPPRVCGYAQTQWSGKLLTQHLEGRYGVKLGPRQCQRLLRRFAPSGPARVAAKAGSCGTGSDAT